MIFQTPCYIKTLTYRNTCFRHENYFRNGRLVCHLPLNFFVVRLSSVSAAELISLYSAEDPVIELVNTNLTVNIYDPEKIWFVEFYAHWCGYCQRFSPIWKQLARDFDGNFLLL